MSFSAMVAADLPALYEALGETASVVIGGGDPVDIYVIPENDVLVEYAEFKTFKAIASVVDGIAVGDTLTVGSAVYEVQNAAPSDDGLETYIGVNK